MKQKIISQKKDNNLLSAALKLRCHAEEQLQAKSSVAGSSQTDDDMQRLLHELQVHQIELQMQNVELRQARDDIESALEKYTDLYDFAPVGYITLNRNGEISAVNLCGADYLGIERAALLGLRFMQFVKVDYRPAFATLLDMVFISQDKQTCEVALLNKGNHPLIVQVEAMAATSGQGCRLALIDITERKRKDTELRDSEQKFRTLAQNAPVNISRYDRQGRIVYLNPRLENILHRPLSEALGKRSSEASQGGVFDALEKVILDVAATGEDASFEQILPSDDGPSTHLLHLTAEREPGGEITGVLAIGRDITEQRRVEEKLTDSERNFRTLAENSPNIIIRYDLDCRRLYVNQAYLRESGILFDQAVGMLPETNWIPDMPVEEYRAKLRQTIETGVGTEILLEWTRQDGQLFSHTFQVVAEYDSQGVVTGCLAIGHNITALKAAELRLIKLTENSPGAMYTFLLRPDGTSCMPYVSRRIEELNGLRPEELAIDLSEAYARVHPDDAARLQESIAESARTLSPWNIEFRIRHPDKGIIWVEGRSIPESRQDGAILWHGFLHDISERKRVEALLNEKKEHLAEMAVELSLAEERERRRIAAELHDGVGQSLLLSKIKLDSLPDVFVSDRDKQIYEDALSLIERTIKDIRSATIQLSPPLLTCVGLEAALEWLTKQMEDDYLLKVEFFDDCCEKPLTEELTAIVYQSARELLINVSKHSGTNGARLTIIRDGDMLVLSIEDQGCGFDVVLDKSKPFPLDCSFGLFNIRQRIKLLGGQFIIESAPGSGTNATIIVPVTLDRQ